MKSAPNIARLGTTDRPLVSVIVPAYGRPTYLRDGIHAILSDGYDNLEVIVVDDGSPTPIAAEIEHDFRGDSVRFVRQSNTGTAGARNFGASLATGKYLLFVDDDDLLVGGSIGWRVDFLEKSSLHSACGGRCLLVREGTVSPEAENCTGDVSHWDLIVRNRFVSPGQVLIRKAAFHCTAGFRRDCPGCDDWDMWLQLSAVMPINAVDKVVLRYRIHSGNLSSNDILMSRGALVVANRALKSVCDRHQGVARYMLQDYLCLTYSGRLNHASQRARRAGRWGTAARLRIEQFRRRTARTAAIFSQKWDLLSRFHTFRMPYAQLEVLGQQCEECRAKELQCALNARE